MRRMSVSLSLPRLTCRFRPRLQLREHLADRIDGAGDAALAELAHAADAEGLQRRQLARIQDVAVRLDGVIEALEAVVRSVGRVEGHDDRRLDGRRQEAPEPEPRHAGDQGAAVMRVAGAARGEPTLVKVLRDRRIEGRDHMGRRCVTPLRGLLHVDPLVVQVQRQRMAVALAALQRAAAHDDEAHPRWPLEALARGGHDGIERGVARVDLERAAGAHGIHDQALAMTGDDLRDLWQRVEDAGAGFTVHQRHVRDRGIGGERALDVRGGELRVLRVIDRGQLAAEHPAYSRDALTVCAVLRDQHVSRAWNQRTDRGLDRERAAALHGDALVCARAVNDLQEAFADSAGEGVEVDIPGAPIAQQALPGAQRGRQGSGGQQIRFGSHRIAPRSDAASPASTLASSTRMTSTAQRLFGAAMLASIPTLASLAYPLSSMPSHSKPRRIRPRISGACSPMPPPKAITSTPPSSLIYAAT